MNKKISFLSLVILIISAIDNMKNMPGAALFGSSLLFFFSFSAILFLIPTALVSAELSAAFPEKGGVYQWVNKAFGSRWAMMAIWLQWINTMVWYPTMLSFIAGTLAYLIYPELAENKIYLITCILTIFWGLTWINLKGIHASSKLTNICSIVGTILPMTFLIALGALWVFSGQTLQISLKPSDMIPSLAHSESWVSLIAIMASFLGMELSGVHVNDIHQPQKNFPRAVCLSALFIFLSMSLSSLAIALVLPEKEILLISGVMQVFSSFFDVFGLGFLTPILALSIAIGSIGTMVNWLISPAKGLLHAAEFGFLPPFFTRKNKAGVASNILLAQAMLVSVFCLVFLFQPSVNGFFWFLTALSTELYMIMYILMFCAALKLHHKYLDRPTTFKIPGGNFGMWSLSLFGLIGCFTTIIVTFFPPGNITIGNPMRYLFMIGIGNLVTISPLLLFSLYKKRKKICYCEKT
ncbi:MAG: amino acid permease [Simkania sp.]|nr:amino acid permease [Simkania sp.]